MNRPSKLRFYDFNNSPLVSQSDPSNQQLYLYSYLHALGAVTVVEEQNYFDRDYLAEHAAFYSISTMGYPNVCKRLHFFSRKVNRRTIKAAAANSSQVIKSLKEHYLGFVVLRPIPCAPLGRTVLIWFPENDEMLPRVKNPSRAYRVHLAGVELSVTGLAWQQQDSAVGACATIGLWTTLHSSSFDELHSIPTTVEITQAANKYATFGSPIFPSKGLTHEQTFDAIREQGLMPIVTEGDMKLNGWPIGFSGERFAADCAAFIKSGYPVLIWVDSPEGAHIVVAAGFRSAEPKLPIPSRLGPDDKDMLHLYIHDDNIGPHARFRIVETILENGDVGVVLEPDPPEYPVVPGPFGFNEEYTPPYPWIKPIRMYVAGHSEIRTSPDMFNEKGTSYAHWFLEQFSSHGFSGDLLFSTKFIKLSEYMGSQLNIVLGDNVSVLSKVRMALIEEVKPMSLYIGLLRIGFPDGTPLIDMLFDTTDCDWNHPLYASICYQNVVYAVVALAEEEGNSFGYTIQAY